MKKIIVVCAALLCFAATAGAQDYSWAAGVRLGGEMGGLSVKHKFNTTSAIEGILAMPWDDGFVVTALYERHVPVIGRGFSLYYGGGGHVGGWKHKFAFGVDGIVGLEYHVPDAPIAFSIDYKPVFNIVERTKFYLADFALGIKFTF